MYGRELADTIPGVTFEVVDDARHSGYPGVRDERAAPSTPVDGSRWVLYAG
ncbi:hypothetical protein ACFWIJ_05150 [Streptomyces sp. NPDC127079]|uniref:hypothetical protein n=1 Tax=Streptomyces sp. NPDC127079 TaxID=3347132 RepID=UPI003651799F